MSQTFFGQPVDDPFTQPEIDRNIELGLTSPGTQLGDTVLGGAPAPEFDAAGRAVPPQDFSGYIPQPPRAAVFGNAIPRASGNDPASPRSVAGARPSVPVWARGLMRSPFARFMQRGSQSSLGRIGGFQEDLAPVEDDPLRRQMESLGLPIIQP